MFCRLRDLHAVKKNKIPSPNSPRRSLHPSHSPNLLQPKITHTTWCCFRCLVIFCLVMSSCQLQLQVNTCSAITLQLRHCVVLPDTVFARIVLDRSASWFTLAWPMLATTTRSSRKANRANGLNGTLRVLSLQAYQFLETQ